jgi:copper chaperone CopZ
MDMKTQFTIEGMHCNACVKKVQQALQAGGLSATVTLEPAQAVVDSAMPVSLKKVQEAVASAGAYSAKVDVISAHNTSANHNISSTVSVKTPLNNDAKNWLQTYQPLLIIIAYIAGVTLLIEAQQGFDASRAMRHFMAGFFLVFSFFKLLNLRAFADAYAGYDLLAMRWHGYGWVYPFIELALGIAYVVNFNPPLTNTITFIVMSLSALGVVKALMDKRSIACACLGAVFNLPMSTVTLIEDLAMVLMAAAMLI